MKIRSLMLVLITASSLVLIGCATVPEQDPRNQQDTTYISVVEHRARMQGVDVIWVNPPRRAHRKKPAQETRQD